VVDAVSFDPALGPWLQSLVVIAVLVIAWGGVRTWRGGDRQKGALMLVCALVILGNLLIWAI
jgi:hypothetical protein